jgi:hypothetical protein
MQRLRDKRPVPGTAEEVLVETVRACGRLDTSPGIKRRVYARVLDVALGRRPRVSCRSRADARHRTRIVVLLLAGVAAASTAGLHWIVRPRAIAEDSPPRVSLGLGHPPTRARVRD